MKIRRNAGSPTSVNSVAYVLGSEARVWGSNPIRVEELQDLPAIYCLKLWLHSKVESRVYFGIEAIMPKLKSRKAAAKRFRASGSGKILRRKSYRAHLLEHKGSSRKRRLFGMAVVNERDADNVRGMLPYL